MTVCSFCGDPITDGGETHHENERRGDNDPDNLRETHRRCHMEHHDNERAVENLTEQRFGPPSPTLEPPGGI